MALWSRAALPDSAHAFTTTNSTYREKVRDMETVLEVCLSNFFCMYAVLCYDFFLFSDFFIFLFWFFAFWFWSFFELFTGFCCFSLNVFSLSFQLFHDVFLFVFILLFFLYWIMNLVQLEDWNGSGVVEMCSGMIALSFFIVLSETKRIWNGLRAHCSNGYRRTLRISSSIIGFASRNHQFLLFSHSLYIHIRIGQVHWRRWQPSGSGTTAARSSAAVRHAGHAGPDWVGPGVSCPRLPMQFSRFDALFASVSRTILQVKVTPLCISPISRSLINRIFLSLFSLSLSFSFTFSLLFMRYFF